MKKLRTIFTEQAALTEQLRAETFSDSLSGLLNRRGFDQRLEHILQRRDGQCYCGNCSNWPTNQQGRQARDSGPPAGVSGCRATAPPLPVAAVAVILPSICPVPAKPRRRCWPSNCTTSSAPQCCRAGRGWCFGRGVAGRTGITGAGAQLCRCRFTAGAASGHRRGKTL